jgi:hypothetical protein
LMVGRRIVHMMLFRVGENPLWGFSDQSSQLFSTVSRTLLVYSLRLSLYRFEASTFAGDPVFGSLSKLWILVSTAATSYVGLHRFCRMSRQSSPVAYTFGWNIWLMNLTCGGLLGYCSSNCITRRNVPSSNGVSAGPIITAFLREVLDPYSVLVRIVR